jgi:membrane-associated protease RseP (regulator of RpoE activity)
LALIALPGGIVLLILVEQLRRRRWTEAMVALGVFSIIVISFLITRR